MSVSLGADGDEDDNEEEDEREASFVGGSTGVRAHSALVSSAILTDPKNSVGVREQCRKFDIEERAQA